MDGTDGGTLTSNGNPDGAAYSANSGRVALTDLTIPSSFLMDGTDGGLNLTDVGYLGDSITFNLSLSDKAILSVNTQTMDFGVIDVNVPHRDSTFVLTNVGGASDSVYLTLDYVNVAPESAVTITQAALMLAAFESKPVTFNIRPRLLATGMVYNAVVMIDSRFGFGRTHYEKTMKFEIKGTLEAVQALCTLPAEFALDQNYPNPFNPMTKIQFTIVNRQLTMLNVFDLMGRKVATVVNEVKEPGTYTVQFDASNLASGVYFYRMEAGPFVAAKKFVVLR